VTYVFYPPLKTKINFSAAFLQLYIKICEGEWSQAGGWAAAADSLRQKPKTPYLFGAKRAAKRAQNEPRSQAGRMGRGKYGSPANGAGQD